MYAKIKNGQIEKTGARPRWLDDEGSPVTDAVLAQHEWLPVNETQPDHDPYTERVDRNPQDQWTVGVDSVSVTYTVTSLAVEEKAAQLEHLRRRKLEEVKQGHANALKALSERYPQTEIDGWPQQEQAARTYLDTGAHPMIERMAQATGQDAGALAQNIAAKADEYAESYADATAVITMLRTQIAAAQTVSELEAVTWPGSGEG